jgi:hypothetical protein
MIDKLKPGTIITYTGMRSHNAGVLVAVVRDSAVVLLCDLGHYVTYKYNGCMWLWVGASR